MSNIPSSERKLTKIDFFDRAIDLHKKVVEYIDCDFGIRKRYCEDGNPNPRYWIYAHIREDIYKATQEISVINSKYSFIIIGYTDTINQFKEEKS